MASTPTNLDKLIQAEVVKKEEVSHEHAKIINEQLSDAEVSAVISATKKLKLKNLVGVEDRHGKIHMAGF